MTDTKNFKELLLEARKLRGKSGENAWKRAKILCQIFEDRDFRDSVGAVDDFKAAEMLNAEVEDLCLTFLQLRQIFIEFPKKSDWADGRLKTLYEKAKSKPVEESDKPKRSVNRITKKEHEQVLREKEEAIARANYSDRQRAELLEKLEQLQGENNQLRGRISELERLLSKERHGVTLEKV